MVLEPHSGTNRPSSINTKAQAAIFDNVEGNEALTLALDKGFEVSNKMVGRIIGLRKSKY